MADTSEISQPQLAQSKEIVMFKNKLQQLAQKASVHLPVYTVFNEGLNHLPGFRATVLINGKSYTTEQTFMHRKEAEQEAARLALEDLGSKIEDYQWSIEHGLSFILEVMVFCKSIFHDFAIKEGLPLPEYRTSPEGVRDLYFVSNVEFNGVTYPSDYGRSKKDAEQLAACAAIHSLLLGDTESREPLLAVIKAQAKHYNAMRVQNPAISTTVSIKRIRPSVAKEVSNNPEKFAAPEDPADPELPLPIEFFPESSGEQKGKASSSSKKRHKNKRKTNKKPRLDAVSALAMAMNSNQDKLAAPEDPADPELTLPIEFVPESSGVEKAKDSSSSRKRRKSRRKTNKKPRLDAGLMIDNALASAHPVAC